jgi:SnoaL-like domain
VSQTGLPPQDCQQRADSLSRELQERVRPLDSGLGMLAGLPDVVRHYFELDPRDVDGFVALFSDEAIVVDEGKTYQGPGEIRAWRTGPAIKYTYATELLDQEGRSGDRYLVTARLTGDFPGETVDLRCDFAVTSDLISRLVIAP